MAFLAGDILDAARLNRIAPVTYRIAQTSIQTVTNVETDVTGAVVIITTAAANAAYSVQGVFDFDVSTGAATVAVGRLNVDGTSNTTSEAHHGGNAVGRETVAQTWTGTLAIAGNHTFKLRVLKTVNTGAINSNSGHTSALITITEVP